MIEQRGRPKRLLVLDDERDVGATICMMARNAGYETDYTDSIDVFIERLQTTAPTHVVVDLQLGDGDGIDVIHRLAKLDCGAGLIIVSGLGGRILESAARAAVENGLWLTGTLAKPFSYADLKSLLIAVESRAPENVGFLPERSIRSVSRAELADALAAEAFVAHYQPKISLATGALVGFECLARWQTNKRDLIAPDVFIGSAEQTGQIHELTRQVYRYALTWRPRDIGGKPLKYALNLSPLNLGDEGFPRWLFEECKAQGIAPSQVILEITETASLNNPLVLLENLTQFRIRGFELSIDDFGVGYSSMVQLARLPFSELKIDRMFVKSLATSEESMKIVSAVIGLGHSLGLNVVAEGVEGSQALELLYRAGCDQAQGYFIAKPMSHQAAALWQATCGRQDG
ncbi:hypothetical protein C84B14_11142 [Salinisphaera sp. C84B14]|uniref:EAL domain-containing response regulator n=1 Tax=Salinisphaera sp. C84B14 TaxID=1304155 RepID=UPI003340E55E